MDPASISLVFAAVGAGMQYKAGQDQKKAGERTARMQEEAGKESQRIANQNAANTESETAEQVRRESIANKEADATRKLKVAGSGGTLSGSSKNFLDEQSQRQSDSIDWLKKSGKSRADIERAQGKYSSMTAKANASATRGALAGNTAKSLSGFADVASGLGNLYNPSTEVDNNSIWT